jgi:hypothetical protein
MIFFGAWVLKIILFPYLKKRVTRWGEHNLGLKIQGKSGLSSVKRKTVFMVQLFKIVKSKLQILDVGVFDHALFENS